MVSCTLACAAELPANSSSSPRNLWDDDPKTETATPGDSNSCELDATFVTSGRKKKDTPLFELLQSLPLINDSKINPKARYVICLYSASWCGPCRRELPGIVAHYLVKTDQGRNKGNMELILFDFDHSEADARAWIAKERVPFPVTYHAPSSLPGASGVSAIPVMIVLDENGRILMKGNPATVLAHWDAIASGRVLPAASLPR